MIIILSLIAATLALTYYFLENYKIGIFLLIFFLPFERIPSYDLPFLGGITIRISQIIAVSLFLAFLVNIIKKKQKMFFDKSLILLLLYLAVVLLSFTQALNIKRSLMVFVFTSFVFLVYFLVINLVKEKEQLRKIEKVFFWSTVTVCLFGIYQFVADSFNVPLWLTGLKPIYTNTVFGFPRIQSTALEPLYFASFLIIPFSIFLGLALRKKEISKRYLLAIFLIIFDLVLTVSRGGFASSIAIFIIFLITAFREWNTKKGIYIISTIILAIFLAVFSIGISTFITNRDVSVGVENLSQQSLNVSQGESVEGRTKARNLAFEIFLKHPILGIGAGNFGPYISNYSSSVPEGGWPIVNNEPLEVLAETGVLGFLILIFALGYIFIKGIIAFLKTNDSYIRVLLLSFLAVLIGFAIQYQTFSTLYVTHIWIAVGLLVVLENMVLGKEKGNV